MDGSSSVVSGGDESIEKLRLANQALRQQLKEFSRALDASLAQHQDLSTATPSAVKLQAKRKETIGKLHAKEKQLKALHKKMEIYKKANAGLKQQLGSSYHPDKLNQLRQEKAEKIKRIEELETEKKTLVCLSCL